MMDRVLEPELMVDPEQVRIYSEADFEEENQGFVDRFLSSCGDLNHGMVLDLGCGPGDIPIRLARGHASVKILGIDASQPMIAIAEQAVRKAGFSQRITLLSQRFQDVRLSNPADAIISNSLLHHVPNPFQFWYAIKNLAKPGAPVLVMDLIRPDSREEAQAIVDQYAADEPEQLRQDFFNSLLAAFTEDEVAAQLAEFNLSRLLIDVPDDRHWIVAGRVF